MPDTKKHQLAVVSAYKRKAAQQSLIMQTENSVPPVDVRNVAADTALSYSMPQPGQNVNSKSGSEIMEIYAQRFKKIGVDDEGLTGRLPNEDEDRLTELSNSKNKTASEAAKIALEYKADEKESGEKGLDNGGKSGIIKTDNKSVREWYVSIVSNIPNELDRSQPFEAQVKQAFELRNKYKHAARIIMSDREAAKTLDIERPVPTFEELLKRKIERKGLTKQEALEDILKTASETNIDVNKEFGL